LLLPVSRKAGFPLGQRYPSGARTAGTATNSFKTESVNKSPGTAGWIPLANGRPNACSFGTGL